MLPTKRSTPGAGPCTTRLTGSRCSRNSRIGSGSRQFRLPQTRATSLIELGPRDDDAVDDRLVRLGRRRPRRELRLRIARDPRPADPRDVLEDQPVPAADALRDPKGSPVDEVRDVPERDAHPVRVPRPRDRADVPTLAVLNRVVAVEAARVRRARRRPMPDVLERLRRPPPGGRLLPEVELGVVLPAVEALHPGDARVA